MDFSHIKTGDENRIAFYRFAVSNQNKTISCLESWSIESFDQEEAKTSHMLKKFIYFRSLNHKKSFNYKSFNGVKTFTDSRLTPFKF